MARDFNRGKSHFGGGKMRANHASPRGMQARDLVAGLDHPIWDAVAKQNRQEEERLGELEVDIDDIFRLEQLGDEETFREFGAAFLRVAEQRGLSFEPETASQLEDSER